jgi:hypothetical protein
MNTNVSEVRYKYGANLQFDSKSPRMGGPTKISEQDVQSDENSLFGPGQEHIRPEGKAFPTDSC